MQMKRLSIRFVFLQLLLCSLLLGSFPTTSEAIPEFSRKYNVNCSMCHAAFPRLNEFGQSFIDSNYRMPNWRDNTISGGDDRLALPDHVPIAIRAQAYGQARKGEAIDVTSGEITQADAEVQSPYLIKILSSAPLSEHITYYFYGIFAEKGGNGETIIEDAWFSHDDLFGSGAGMMVGQFQISDLMYPRETRLTFQDFMVYRMAGITYDRGVAFNYDLGFADIALGTSNGNGITSNLSINSPGYKRADRLFDNDNSKSVFGRLGSEIGPVSGGLFAYSGFQKNATGAAGTDGGNRDTDKKVYGFDLNGMIGSKTYWFSQALWSEWDEFINVGQDYKWFGAFVGVDYIHSPTWTYSALVNYADAKDLENSDTIYEGIDMKTLTFTASHYFMLNIKGVIEYNIDLLDKVQQTGTYYTGHLSKEDYLLIGFDAAF